MAAATAVPTEKDDDIENPLWMDHEEQPFERSHHVVVTCTLTDFDLLDVDDENVVEALILAVESVMKVCRKGNRPPLAYIGMGNVTLVYADKDKYLRQEPPEASFGWRPQSMASAICSLLCVHFHQALQSINWNGYDAEIIRRIHNTHVRYHFRGSALSTPNSETVSKILAYRAKQSEFMSGKEAIEAGCLLSWIVTDQEGNGLPKRGKLSRRRRGRLH